MKKWIAYLVVLGLLAGILPAALAAGTDSDLDLDSTGAAATTSTENTTTLQVGFGRADVTPMNEDGTVVADIHLAGSGDADTRLAEDVASDDERLYMNAVALSDGTNTHVIMTTDFIRVPTKWNEYVEEAVIAELAANGYEYNLPEHFLSMSATHTHSSVDIGDAYERDGEVINNQDAKWHTSNLDGNNKGKETTYYEKYWLPGAVGAVKAALADLQTATVQVGSVTLSGITWVRHWLYSDGTMNGSNFESSGGTAVCHPRDADSEMQLIRFVRADDKDVVLINWQAHPTGAMGSVNKMLSSEYCGVMCRYLEGKDSDCYAAFFQGAAGNLRYASKIGSMSYSTNYKDYGQLLGEKAWNALQASMQAVEPGAVKSMRNESTVVERGYKTTRTIQQDVVTVGNSIAFVTAGYEMFDSNGLFVKAQARNMGYEIIFIIENAQGHEYMPDWQATHYTLLGGAEAYEATGSCHNEVPGTAEDLADSLVFMLDALYKQ